MAIPRETGRQRAMRIPMDYFKRANPLERGKLWLAFIAVVGTLAWIGYSLAQGERGNKVFSRGDLASVHSAWNNTCEACHVDFNPITRHTFLSSPAAKATADARCESCHLGTVHHKNQSPESTASCGGCHRDHRGVDASLVRLGDADCTICHGNLTNHLVDSKGAQSQFTNVVTNFADKNGHPEFKVLRDKLPDPGVIKFNHALHMTPGQVIVAGQKSPWTLEKLKASDKDAYDRYVSSPWQKDKSDQALVALDCRSCHELDSADVRATRESIRRVPSAVLPNRAEGAYLLPIVYDVHCKACHPLQFDDKVPSYVAPHRYQPEEIRTIVGRTYAAEFLQKNPELLKAPLRPLPGKSLTPEQEKAKTYIDGKVELAMKTLFLGKKTCGECHYAEGKTDESQLTEIPRKLQVGPSEATKKAGWFQNESSIPDVWLLHAKFNHASHRAVDCRQCHENAYGLMAGGQPNPKGSVTHKDVLLPGVENCRECHRPARTEGALTVGGVRHDCTECHRYHHGDSPLQGLGAQALDPKTPMGIKKFLQGAQD